MQLEDAPRDGGHHLNVLARPSPGVSADHAGTTLTQVTHSEENATYGSRIIQLRDGWIHKG